MQKLPPNPSALLLQLSDRLNDAANGVQSTLPSVGMAFNNVAYGLRNDLNAMVLEEQKAIETNHGPIATSIRSQARIAAILERNDQTLELNSHPRMRNAEAQIKQIAPPRDEGIRPVPGSHDQEFIDHYNTLLIRWMRPYFYYFNNNEHTPEQHDYHHPVGNYSPDVRLYPPFADDYQSVNTNLLNEQNILPIIGTPVSVFSKSDDVCSIHLRFRSSCGSQLTVRFSATKDGAFFQSQLYIYNALEDCVYNTNDYHYLTPYPVKQAIDALMIDASYVQPISWTQEDWNHRWEELCVETPYPALVAERNSMHSIMDIYREGYIEYAIVDDERKPTNRRGFVAAIALSGRNQIHITGGDGIPTTYVRQVTWSPMVFTPLDGETMPRVFAALKGLRTSSLKQLADKAPSSS